jgi:hypothetical protein
MAFTDTKLSYFHSFSKMPAQDSTSLGNAINKSGHTVTASEVWAQDIPYYGKMGSIEDVKSKVQPYARKNDMCYITAGADKGKTFQYDGNGNWTDITATLVDGALIKNANDDVVLLYHKGQTLTNLTADNNANTDSANNAARLWAKRDTEGVAIANDGTRLIEQFVAPTDKALNGLASVAYAPVIANGSLISGTNYYDYCFSGTILWAEARSAATLIDCFEYVGDKIDTTISNIRKDVQDIIGTTMEGVVASVGTNDAAQNAGIGVDSTTKTSPKITFTAGSVTTGETKLVSGGAVAAVTDALAGRISALEGVKLSVQVVDSLPTTPVVNTLYLVPEQGSTTGTYVEYIAYKPEGSETVTTERIGTTAVDLEGYTTDAEHTALAERVTALDAATTGRVAVVEGKVKTLEETTIPAAITTAQGYTDTKIAEELETGGSIAQAIANAKEQAIANAKVTLTAGTGITIPNSGEQDTAFTVSVDTDVIATKQSVDDLSGIVTALSETVASNKTDLEGQITNAQTILQGSIDGVSEHVTTLETVTVPGIDTRLQTAEATITSLTTGDASVDSKVNAAKTELQGKIDAINTSLTTGDIHTEIDGVRQTANAAKATADSAVQSVTKASGSSDLLTVTDGTDVTISLSTEVATKSDASKAATDAVNGLKDTAITSQNVSGAGVSVTLAGKVGAPTLTGSVTPATYISKSWINDGYLAKASDVKAAIADAVGAIEFPKVTWN